MMLADGLPSAVAAKVTGKAKRKQGKRYGYVTHQPIYHYQGVNYRINTTQTSGCYTKPLSEMIRRIVEAVARYRRVLFVRLDLSMGEGEATSKRLSVFLKQAGRHVMREHGTRLEYVWCREQEKAKRQHYHLALLIDGDKLRHPARLYKELAEIWQRKGGRLSIPENGYLMTDSHNIAEAVYRVSYLTKERGKGYRPDGVRDFGYSHLIKTGKKQTGEQ
ncbi:inovirus-type Gp2 protein [Aeromonas veronii]